MSPTEAPGRDSSSLAFNNGRVISSIGSQHHGGAWNPNDVIGCGIVYNREVALRSPSRGTVFFTLNGKFLTVPSQHWPFAKVGPYGLHAAVGLGNNDMISANFGQAPFMFKIARTVRC